METPLLEIHRAAGAQLAAFDGCLLPQRFAGFEEEYRAGREAAALLDTNWHAILRLAGSDRVQYLHAITSNNIKALATGRGLLALLLNPQGHILAELEVYSLPDNLLLLSHASLQERTVTTLRKYVIASKVVIEDVTPAMGSLAIEGPRAPEAIEQLCGVAIGTLPEMAVQEIQWEGAAGFLLRRSLFGQPGAQLIVPRDALASVWRTALLRVQAVGGTPIGHDAFHALRLEAGVPWFPADFYDQMIPHEAGLENTHVSFNKGCYTGQEIVERVRSRGHVNRKRVQLQFSAAAPPAPGTKLLAGATEAGFVTSAAYSPSAGASIGMGYVRREHWEAGTTLEFDGGKAEVRG